MKTIQLQRKVLTELTKELDNWIIEELENKYLISNGYLIHIISKYDFYLNPDKFRKFDEGSLSKILEKREDEKVIEAKGIEYREKGELLKFEDVTGEMVVYANPDYFKYFENYVTYCKSPTSPIFVEEMGELVGLVLPVNIPASTLD